jgi:exonuclease III
MRLIIWNCKGAFHRKHDFVAALRPDILIIPECEKLTAVSQPFDSAPVRSFEWFGSNPRKGLAIISYGNYALEVHPSYDSRHRWIVPLSISGPMTFILFAVWTLPVGDHSGRYVRPLFEAFTFYQPLIDSSEVVWAGDFNSSFLFDEPLSKYKFRDFVALLDQHGLHSLYHHQRECEHGKELDKTFYLYHHADKGYHIDYVFATDRLHPHGFDVSVGSHLDWSKRSDHAPLVCEFFDLQTDRKYP